MIYEQWIIPCTYIGSDVPPGPSPETAGLEEGYAYLVMATMENCDEEGEIWYNVINRKGQSWSLSNRHFRTVQVGVIGMSGLTHWMVPLHSIETTQEILEGVECLDN